MPQLRVKEVISTSTLPKQPGVLVAGVLVAKRHHLLVRWSHWLNVPILLGLILSGISIYWSSPIYQHKPDPLTGNFDVAADIGIWICAHVPGLHHYSSPPDWWVRCGARLAFLAHVGLHPFRCASCGSGFRRRVGYVSQHAAVFCVDEKTAIQALDRLDPVLPLSPGRAERHGFEYYRHGTLSLYAALDVQTGKVHGKTAKRHTSAEFVDFLEEVVARSPEAPEIHIVLDNLSAQKTETVREFLERNPRVRFHFTPTYSSWLNQVELWFAKIQRDVIARGVFTSVADLSRKLMKYIRVYAKSAKPFRWNYTDPSHRIKVTE